MCVSSKRNLSGFILGIFLLTGCAFYKVDADKVDSISAQEAAVMIAGKEAVIVDVREDSEWNENHIPGAIHIPLGQLNERLSELQQYKNSLLVAQCRSGGRSVQASVVLKTAGFTKVYSMTGGILAWNKEGLNTE